MQIIIETKHKHDHERLVISSRAAQMVTVDLQPGILIE